MCIRFGFCLPPTEIERLAANPPADIDGFTEAALVSEGYGFTKSDRLFAEARNVVERAFIDHLLKYP